MTLSIGCSSQAVLEYKKITRTNVKPKKMDLRFETKMTIT